MRMSLQTLIFNMNKIQEKATMEDNRQDEIKEFATFFITSSEGEEIEFEYDKKSYVAAARVVGDGIDEEGIYIYRVKVGEDDFQVSKITNKFEYEHVVQAYMEMDEQE